MSELTTIPGIGKRLAKDLCDLGLRVVADLRNNDPEKLYSNLKKLRGRHVDRCVLYAFRCAVYYASHKKHDQRLLHWWNWKDL